MSSTDNIPLNHTRSIIEVDISHDDDNDKPIEKSNNQRIQTLKTSKRSFTDAERTDKENDIEPKRKRERTEQQCPLAQGNKSTSKTTIEVIDISDDKNDNEDGVLQNGINRAKQYLHKDKQLEEVEKEWINMNKQILEKEKALEQCEKKMIEQEKYIQNLLSALKNSTKESQLEQPKVIEQEYKKKQSFSFR
jgi:hypothetical protein